MHGTHKIPVVQAHPIPKGEAPKAGGQGVKRVMVDRDRERNEAR